jgi:membrane protease YdiL (CAAX protease family)
MSGVSSKPALQEASKPLWSPVTAILIVIIIVVLMPLVLQTALLFVPQLFGVSGKDAAHWLSNSTLANFVYVLCIEVISVGILAWFLKRRRVSFWTSLGIRRPKWSDAGYTILGIVAYFALFAVTLGIVQSITHVDTTKEQALGFEKGIGGFNLLLAFCSLVILPPLAEELTFRGFLYGTLRRYRVSVIVPVLITSLLFGFFHLFGTADGSLLWIAAIDTFTLSLVLCVLRERTGSICACIALHMLKNCFVFINLFIISAR